MKDEQLECLGSEDTPAAPWSPILLIHVGSQIKTRQSQINKIKELVETKNFLILRNKIIHVTYLLKLLDKMGKYEMDLARIVEDTKQTWFCLQTDRRMDGQTDGGTDGQTVETSILLSTALKLGGGVIMS